MNNFIVHEITTFQSKEWIIKKHYAHRMPSISYAFGLFEGNVLKGVCCFGSPPSPSLCIGLCGDEYKHFVLELNRLIVDCEENNITSYFVSRCLKLIPKPRIIVSYADTSQNHTGYIYQACNFIYTGLSAKRTEWREIGVNTHSKTVCGQNTLEERKESDRFSQEARPQKHRYIYFLGSKYQKKQMLNKLSYPILPYPKGVNIRYDASYIPTVQLELL